MRILHTSDWHLGKRLFKLDRTEEHAFFLNWLVKTLVDQEIDLLLIAGDIFDTPTPPHQSLEMFYAFLHRVSHETKAETLIIAGNHDSGLLLEAPSELLKKHRVKVWGKLNPDKEHHWYHFKGIDICAIPYFRSYELLPQGEGDALVALKNYLLNEKKHPQLLLMHHLAGMYEAAGSEQIISLSGVDSIPQEILKSFDYVALGHIHKPQRIASNAYYSGSPIPLRFSETKEKSVVILKDLVPEIHPIPCFRKLITLRAGENDYSAKLAEIMADSPLTPMVELQIKLKSPRVGLIDEVRELLRSKGMELLSLLPEFETEINKSHNTQRLYELSTLEIFEEFYASKYPSEPKVPEELMFDFTTLLDKVKNASQ